MKKYRYLLAVTSIFMYFLFSFINSTEIYVIDVIITFSFILIYRKYNLKNRKILKRYLTIPLLLPVYLLLIIGDQYQNLVDFWRYISLICITIDYIYGVLEQWLFNNKRYLITLLMVSVQFFGTIGFMHFEALSMNESFWLTFISATTVGYGDISAVTQYGQYVTYIIVLTGNLIYGALLISLIVNWFKKRDENNYKHDPNVNKLFEQFKNGNITVNELEKNINQLLKQGEE